MFAWALTAVLAAGNPPVATGKYISPLGTHTEVGSYPVNQLMTPDGRFTIVTTCGFREFLSVISTSDGKLASQIEFNGKTGQGGSGLYYGLALAPDGKTLYVSYGSKDQIGVWALNSDGTLVKKGEPITIPKPQGAFMPSSPAGLAVTSDGSRLVVVNNQTTHTSDYKGSVSVIDLMTGSEAARIPTAGFPYALALLTKGPMANQIAYVGSERDGLVEIVDLANKTVKGQIKTGAAPSALLLTQDQKTLFVANTGSDTVSAVDLATRKVRFDILLRPSDMRGLPGCQPLGMALSADEKTLFVTLSDMNAVAVVDLPDQELEGYLPTGWLPTSVVYSKGNLLVTEAKGTRTQNPNAKAVGDRGQYIQNIIPGTLSRFAVPPKNELRKHTLKVVQNNRITPKLDQNKLAGFNNPGIKYVIYIVKENRTYDNVLGDLPQGNGDPKLTLFPRAVTPNQHALAERFVLLDNFHVCAEVSQDGWVWSTAGMVNAYASRNTPYNYSGRGRNYDTEGMNNGIPVDLIGIPDVTTPPGGYIWDQCAKWGVSFRDYGFFTDVIDPLDKRHAVIASKIVNGPTKRALLGKTNTNFSCYDLMYPDSEAGMKYGWKFPKQIEAVGDFKSPSRFTEWKREFDGFVKAGKMPQFQMVRFCTNHTRGTANNAPTPQAMVADNDYAVGQLVEAVSKTKFWKNTVICVIEDDAQNGYDHVDAHRSTAFVISPWIKKGTIDSRFYNTDSMLRTMELLLGMPPMSQFDAVASPINVFAGDGSNIEPFKAILPAKEIVCSLNQRQAYRQKDSDKIPIFVEESAIDEELNDILWGAIKGKNSPRPGLREGLRLGLQKDEDD